MAFPLVSPPTGYAVPRFATGLGRNNICYEGDTITVQLSTSGPTAYEVIDWWDNVVASGAVSGTSISLGSSWDPGWYRLRLTNAVNDATYGYARGAMNFGVIRANANFPTMPPDSTYIVGGDEVQELITKPCLGMGTTRMSILDVSDPNNAGTNGSDRLVDVVTRMEGMADWWLNPDYADPVRERKQWVAFPNQTFDYFSIDGNAPGTNTCLSVFVADPSVDGTKVFIKSEAGTNPGTLKFTVRYPDSATVVETYDNLTLGRTALTISTAAINAASAYVKVFLGNDLDHFTASGPTAIGDDFRQGVIEIVETLYPLGVTHYEGQNEPGLQLYGAQYAHVYRLLQDAVHTGHADAKVMGPSTVNITDHTAWRVFLDAGGGDYLDVLSFHDYNSIVVSDINLGRNSIEEFFAMLAEYGLEDMEMWQTEAGGAICSTFGVYHPKRARGTIASVLLWEQYGIPAEKNPYWYDWSHGFWAYPAFLFHVSGSTFPDGLWGTRSANPQAILWGVLGQETFGKAFHHRIDFGSVHANSMFIGNSYGSSDEESVAVMMCASHIPNSSVTLTIVGTTDPITVVNPFGLESTETPVSGRITVDVGDVPTYVRLPEGVAAWVYSVNDHGHNPSPNVSPAASSATLGGLPAPELIDNGFMTNYTGDSSSTGIAFSTASLPDEVVIPFPSATEVERVIVTCGVPYQSMCGLLDYDVDTLGMDGTTWTTRATIDRTDEAETILYGTNATDAGCSRETFWTEQWIEDVAISPAVTCLGIRLTIRAISYGGEPDSAGAAVNAAFGQSTTTPVVTIQDIAVISPSSFDLPEAYDTTVVADGAVDFWELGEAAGATTAVDSINSLANATLSGSTTMGVAGAVNDGSTAMYNNPSHSGSFIVPNVLSLRSLGDVFSLEAWYMTTIDAGGYKTIFQKGSLGEYFRLNTSRYVEFGYRSTILATSTIPVAVDTWTHIVCTKDGATSKIYVNGADVTSVGTDATVIDNTQTSTINGANYNRLHKLAVYPTALSAGRVLAHYQAAVAPTRPTNVSVPLVAA